MSASLAVGCGDPPGYANDRSRQEPVRRRGPTADRRCAHRMLGPLVGIPDTREADDPRHRPGWSSLDEVRASPGSWRPTARGATRPGEIHMSDHSGQTPEMGRADGPAMIQTGRRGEALVSAHRHGPRRNSTSTREHLRSTSLPSCGRSRRILGSDQGRSRRFGWSPP